MGKLNRNVRYVTVLVITVTWHYIFQVLFVASVKSGFDSVTSDQEQWMVTAGLNRADHTFQVKHKVVSVVASEQEQWMVTAGLNSCRPPLPGKA